MRNDLTVNLPSLPLVCGRGDCGCAKPEVLDGSEDMRVVFKQSRLGSYDAEIRNEYGDLIDVLHGADVDEVLEAAHLAYPFALSHTIENNHGHGRHADQDLNFGEADAD